MENHEMSHKDLIKQFRKEIGDLHEQIGYRTQAIEALEAIDSAPVLRKMGRSEPPQAANVDPPETHPGEKVEVIQEWRDEVRSILASSPEPMPMAKLIDIAGKTGGIGESVVRATLKDLIDSGVVKRVGWARGTKYTTADNDDATVEVTVDAEPTGTEIDDPNRLLDAHGA